MILGQIGFEQGTRVLMLRCGKNAVHGARFNDLGIAHHDDVVGHGADHRYVVGDEQVTQAFFALQGLQQFEDLFLNRHIQRAGGLIQHQQTRLNYEGAGNGQTLALTT